MICTYDPATAGGQSPPPDADGNVRKVKSTIHWVSAAHAIPAEVRLFDRLFSAEEPGRRTGEPADDLNPSSLEILTGAVVEPAVLEDLRAAASGRDGPGVPPPLTPATIAGARWSDGIARYQFERLGYFALDPDTDLGPGTPRLVFNRTVTLKDEWARQAAKG